MELEPREQFELFLGGSVCTSSLPLKTYFSLSLYYSTSRPCDLQARMVLAKGTLTLKWEFGIRHVWGTRFLEFVPIYMIIMGHLLLGRIRELGHAKKCIT